MKLAPAPGLAFVALLAVITPVGGNAVLTVTDPSPFTVRGVGFVPYERVTVVVQLAGTHVRTITATKTGAFVVRFSAVSVGHCPAYIVRATGNRGSKAYLRVIRECMPLGPPPP